MANAKNGVIEMPPIPTYGAVELKEFINKNTIRGFIITMILIIFLLLLYFVVSMMSKSSELLHTAPIVSKLSLVAAPSTEDENQAEQLQQQTPQVINYGIESRAGTPVPIPDAEIKQDIEFATTKDIERATSEVGNVDISQIQDFNPDELSKQKEFKITDEIPPDDVFIPTEKEPNVDLAELQRKIVYPEMARRANIEGKVIVRVYVDKTGKPKKVNIQQSDSQLLNQAAIDAVMKTVFTPGIQNKQAIGCWVSIPIQFQLR